MPAAKDAVLRRELIAGLRGGHAHARFEDVVANFPAKLQGETAGLPYSAWQLLEHLRLAQNDIVRFCDNHDGSYKEMKFPDDYWPASAAPPADDAWIKSIALVQEDRFHLVRLLEDPARDLREPFAWGDGQSLLREAILVIDHNSYHLGELLALRRLLGIWPPKKEK